MNILFAGSVYSDNFCFDNFQSPDGKMRYDTEKL